jgi:hypothetical protein
MLATAHAARTKRTCLKLERVKQMQCDSCLLIVHAQLRRMYSWTMLVSPLRIITVRANISREVYEVRERRVK